MQSGHADIDDKFRGPTEMPGRQQGLARDGQVGGSCRADNDESAGRFRSARRPDEQPRDLVVERVGEHTAYGSRVVRTRPGKDRRSAVPALADRPGNVRDLAWGLAFAVDRLWVATAVGALEVEPVLRPVRAAVSLTHDGPQQGPR